MESTSIVCSDQSQKDKLKEVLYSKVYLRNKDLGSGASGQAWLIKNKNNQKELVLKEVDLMDLLEDSIKMCLEEARIMKLFDHPNIIKIHDCFMTKSKKLQIIMQYASKGELNDHIVERQARLEEGDESAYFTEEEVLNIFAQLLMAIQTIHNQNILHRDVKCHNILVMENGQIKVADFGFACVIENTQSLANLIVGTPNYLAPDVIKGRSCSVQSDIWSLGIVLYRLCALCHAFEADCNVHLVEQICTKEPRSIPQRYSQSIDQLIQQMLQKDPKERITLEEILKIDVIEQAVARVVQLGLSERTNTAFRISKVQESDLLFQEAQKQLLQESNVPRRSGPATDKQESTPQEISFPLALRRRMSSHVSHNDIHKLDLQTLSDYNYKKKIQQLYGQDIALKAFEILADNKDILYEKDAKSNLNELLLAQGLDFGAKQEEFIKQASFRIIIENMRQRGEGAFIMKDLNRKFS